MPGQGINVGGIYADLEVNSDNIPRGLAAAEQAISAFEARIRQLDSLLSKGAIGGPEHAAQVAQLTQAIQDMAATMQSAHAQIGGTANAIDLMNVRMQAGATSAGRMSMAMMQLGYMFDDAQYGLAALSNNIAPFVYGLTGNAGIAAGAQIAAVAIVQLTSHLDQLREALGDDTGMESARRSLEGLSSQLKELQKDAESFSWPQTLTKGIVGTVGVEYNPDEGKAAKAAGMAEDLKERKRDSAVADKAGNVEEPAEKKERERFTQAVGEHDAEARRLGTETAEQKLARKNIETRGAAEFLDPNKGAVRGLIGDKAADVMGNPMVNPVGAAMGLGRKSQKDEYLDLQAKEKSGQKLSEVEEGRKRDLDELARQAAVKQAHEEIGKGARDRGVREKVAGAVGGDRGEVIAGRKETDKDLTKERKELEKFYASDAKEADATEAKKRHDRDSAWEKEGREREKQVKEIAARGNPNLREDADRLANKVEEGKQEEPAGEAAKAPDPESPEGIEVAAQRLREKNPKLTPREARNLARRQAIGRRGQPPEPPEPGNAGPGRPKGLDDEGAVQQLKAKVKAKSPELSDEEAEGVAREQMGRTKKEDPEDRAAKIKADNLKQLKKVDPDIERNAEAAAAMGMATGKGTEDWSKKMREKLVKERGMGEIEADDAVQGVLKGAKQKVNDRLSAIRGPRNEGQQEVSHSETLRTGDLTSRVQGAVSNQDPMAEAKKHTSQHDKQIELLEQIANKRTIEIGVA